MKYLLWVLKAALFFVLFVFALYNQEPVLLRWFTGQWEVPLVVLLLTAVLLGMSLGAALMLPAWLRARRSTDSTNPHPPASTAHHEADTHGI